MVAIAVRWGGWMLVAGSVLLGAAIVALSLRPKMNEQVSPGVSALLLVSAILLLLSLPAMYAVQARSAGWLGLAGFGLLQTGVLLIVLVASTPL
ncbi:MAG TPA: hypothetical protein VF163_01865, partial [Micromonosporaceae bacterium]